MASTNVLRSASVHGYTTAFEVSALLVAAAAVVAAIFVGSKRAQAVHTEIPSAEERTLVFAGEEV